MLDSHGNRTLPSISEAGASGRSWGLALAAAGCVLGAVLGLAAAQYLGDDPSKGGVSLESELTGMVTMYRGDDGFLCIKPRDAGEPVCTLSVSGPDQDSNPITEGATVTAVRMWVPSGDDAQVDRLVVTKVSP